MRRHPERHRSVVDEYVAGDKVVVARDSKVVNLLLAVVGNLDDLVPEDVASGPDGKARIVEGVSKQGDRLSPRVPRADMPVVVRRFADPL